MTTRHACDGRPDLAISRQRKAQLLELRRRVWIALEAGPGTAAEIRNRMGEYEWQATEYWGGECRGHLGDRVYVSRFGQPDVQRELVRLEKQGLVERLIIEGWQAHLWWAR